LTFKPGLISVDIWRGTDKARDFEFVKTNFTKGPSMKGHKGRGSTDLLFLWCGVRLGGWSRCMFGKQSRNPFYKRSEVPRHPRTVQPVVKRYTDYALQPFDL